MTSSANPGAAVLIHGILFGLELAPFLFPFLQCFLSNALEADGIFSGCLRCSTTAPSRRLDDPDTWLVWRAAGCRPLKIPTYLEATSQISLHQTSLAPGRAALHAKADRTALRGPHYRTR